MKPLNPTESTTPAAAQWSTPPAVAQERLGCELKLMFDHLTAGPLPDRLGQLAAAVDEALRRGDLYGDSRPRRAL
jgi:hypothetical protein